MTKKKKMTPQQEHEFYQDPRNLEPQGPAVRRKPTLSETVPVRLAPEMLDEIREAADAEYRSVGSFIRVALANELARRRASKRSSAGG